MMAILNILLATLILQGAPSAPPSTGSIEGSVVGVSGESLSKVTLTLTGPTEDIRANAARVISPNSVASAVSIPAPSNSYQVSATTGVDGKFVFTNLRPGSYRLLAARAGYVSIAYGQKGPNGRSTPIVVAAGQKVNNIQFTLIPDGIITGRIADSNGQPVSRATVQAVKYTYAGTGRMLDRIRSATTNEMGEYRLFWLSPGSYYLLASPGDTDVLQDSADGSRTNPLAGLPPNDAAMILLRLSMAQGRIPGTPVSSRTLSDGTVQQEASVPVFYPGVTSAHDAVPVTVRGGTTVGGVNFTVAPVRVQTIRGITVDGTTGRRGSMQLRLISKSGESGIFYDNPRSSDSGEFEIPGVVPGSYWLTSTDDEKRGFTSLEVGRADVNNVVVTATSGFTMKGQIHWDGIPPDSRPSLDGVQIRIMSTTAGMPSGEGTMVSNGTFTIPQIFPGIYMVGIFGPGNADRYIKSVRLGNQEGLLDGLRMDSQPDGLLDIVLSAQSGKLEGRVVDERHEPVSNATVVVVPDPPLRQRESMYLTPVPDASGKFRIDAMPGRYKVFAWQDVEPGAWFDPDFLRTNESRGISVTINDGGTDTVEVSVIPYIP